MIEIRCPETPTVRRAKDHLDEFLYFMGYDAKGYIKALPQWRSHDYKYYLEIGLPNVEDFAKIIQGAFDEQDSTAPVEQIKRYLLGVSRTLR